jgi:hypothetical protein
VKECCLCADAEYSADSGYAQHIQAAVGAASSALLDTVTRAGLRQTLAALKSYFLLARGDLFTVFVDIAEAELAKNAADVILTRLQSLLELGANWVCCFMKKLEKKSYMPCGIRIGNMWDLDWHFNLARLLELPSSARWVRILTTGTETLLPGSDDIGSRTCSPCLS